MKICRRFRDVNVNNLASQAIFYQCSIYSGLYSQKYKFAWNFAAQLFISYNRNCKESYLTKMLGFRRFTTKKTKVSKRYFFIHKLAIFAWNVMKGNTVGVENIQTLT